MLELADRHDLGSCAARRVGSSPTVPIQNGQTSSFDWSSELKFEKTIQDDHQIKVTVEVDAERLETAKRRAARKFSERGKIPGFRPGKAPYETVRRFYGEPAIYEQAVDLLVDEVYPDMLKEADIQPAAAGTLEKIEGTDIPKFTFLVPLAPEVQLGDYQSIRVPYEFNAPGEDKLNQALEELQQMYATTEAVEREVQEGDYLLVDLKSSQESLTRSGFATMVRKEDKQDEFPFQGFARQLLGLKLGESKTVSHQFPKETEDPLLADQTADIEATIKTVRAVSLPELNDEFAKMVGTYENLEALKDALRKDIEERARADYEDGYYAGIIDKIKEGATIKFAPQTLNHEAEHVIDELRQRLAGQNLDLETYYKIRNTDAAKFLEEEAKPVAKKRLERSLVLDEISRLEKIDVDNQSLDQEFNNTLVDLQMRGVNLSKIRGGKQGQQKVAEAVALESANRLLTRRTLERLKAIATGEYVPPQEAETEKAAESGEQTAEAKPAKEGGKAVKKAAKAAGSGKTGKDRKSTAKKSTTKKK